MKRLWLLVVLGVLAVVSPAHAYNASAAFYDNERVLGHYWVTDPLFGAKCDGATNDRSSIVSADIVAAVVGGQVFFPPATCMTDQELVPSPGVAGWYGTATSPGKGTILRASVAMRSLIALHTTNASLGVEDTTPVEIFGLNLDANNIALYGALRNSDYLSRWHNIFATNALLDGMHAQGHRLPLLFGAVSLGGGAPAGFTVTQPDIGYQQIGLATVVVKCVSTTKYVVSVDGGSTFSTIQFSITPSGASNLFVGSTSASNFTGIQLHFPAGPFANGNTYTFTTTVQFEDQVTTTVNVETEIDNLWAQNCGSVPLEAGTVTVNAGSNLVTGSGTTWMTGPNRQMRPGDSITITLAGISGPGTTVATLPVMGVGDDNDIYLYPFDVPQTSGSGLAYSRAIGYGYYDDDSGDMVRNTIRRGVMSSVANGVRVCGDASGGPMLETMRISSPINGNTGIGVLLGGVVGKAQNAVFNALEIKSGWGTRVYVPFGSSSYFIEPRQALALGSVRDFNGAGTCKVTQNGSDMRYSSAGGGLTVQAASLQPFNSLQLIANTVSMTGANQVIAAPQLNTSLPNNTSYTIVTPNADYVDGNSMLLAAPNDVGQVWIIENWSGTNNVLGLEDQSLIGSNTNLDGSQQVLFGGERIVLISTLYPTVFNPRWAQFGPVQRLYAGPAQKGSQSSSVGGGSCYLKTTSATPGVLCRSDLSFAAVAGALYTYQVSAVDMGNTDRGFWADVQCAFDSTSAVLGSITIRQQRGTSSGNPPAGWGLGCSVVNVGGDLQLQLAATGASGRTIKWFSTSAVTSAVRN